MIGLCNLLNSRSLKVLELAQVGHVRAVQDVHKQPGKESQQCGGEA